MPAVVPFLAEAGGALVAAFSAGSTVQFWVTVASSSAIGLHERGTNVAQLQAVLVQRDAQLKWDIAESMHRNRRGWGS